jgi:fused signal recognition particle receptor
MTVSLAILIALCFVALLFFLSRSSKKSSELETQERVSLEEKKSKRLSAKPASTEPATAAQRAQASDVQEDVEQVTPIPEPGRDVVSAQSEVAEEELGTHAEPQLEEHPATVHDIDGLRKGLERSRRAEGFFGRLAAILRGKRELSPEVASEIEEVLLTSDVGVQTTQAITERIRENLTKRELNDPDLVWEAVRDEARRILRAASKGAALKIRNKPAVILLVGVNGAGKTTTIGKLATRFKSQGRSVILAAGDTFRAAAVQQLCVWGDRIGVEVVRGKDGADPGSVVFDAVRKAKESGIDIVLADTAGRLHTKANLMAELKKVIKTTSRALDETPFEVLLVVDATNGQNAVAQAKEFCAELPLTGMVLTKLDGTAKGGFVVGIAAALQLPVKLIGLGEKATDLHDFDPDDFVEALLGQAREGASA